MQGKEFHVTDEYEH